MAGVTMRNASASPDENLMQSQEVPITSNAARAAARRRQQRTSSLNPATMNSQTDSGHISQASEFQRAHSISYKDNPGPMPDNSGGRSFAARTRDLPPERNKSLRLEPSNLSEGYPEQSYPADPHIPAPSAGDQGGGIQKVSSPLDSGSQPTSSGQHSTKDQTHDWAHDRSPLQKLEVTLTGISKEDKRAKAQEAEKKLRERMARKILERSNREMPPPNGPRDMAPAEDTNRKNTNPERAVSDRRPRQGQSAERRESDIQPAKRREPRQLPVDNNRGLDPEAQRQFEKPRSTHNRAPSFHYAEMRPPREPQYVEDVPVGPPMRKGSAPRRSVTLNNQTGANSRDMPSDIQDFAAGPSAPSKAGPPMRQMSIPRKPVQANDRRRDGKQGFVGDDQFRQRQQPIQLGPNPGMGAQRQQPIQLGPSPGMGAQRQQPIQLGPNPGMRTQQPQIGVYPPGDVNKPSLVRSGTDQKARFEDPGQPQGAQNGVKPQSKPKRNTVSFNVPPPTPPPLSEWKNAPIARLNASDFDFQNFDMDRSKAWWEGGGTANRRKSRALPNEYHKPVPKPKVHKSFQPAIFLKCGPLLRYTGMRRTRVDGPNGPFDKETWRGTILIVTKDSRSTYDPPPTLRLFSQPMNLLPPPPVEVSSEDGELPPEYVDPTAGLTKLGRDGRPLYIKPVEHTEEEVDLSFVENDDGIYELSPSILDYSAEGVKQSVPANRVHSTDGETVGAYKELAGVRLYADPDRDVTFWRFNLEVDLCPTQQRVAYRLNQGPALGFWVPARGEPMNIMFHTCNGFSTPVDSHKFCGPDPLWRDVINEHQTRPFHVMVGGGDQIFNDRVIEESPYLEEWIKIKSMEDKHNTPFSPEFRAEVENFYLENYSSWFSQGLFSFANSQIPMVNIWNDHEIIEGFGSYPDEFMGTPVISGLGRIAFKYYLLFQHHSVPEETEEDEPSWLLGAQLGPYINQKSRSVFMSFGKGVAFLGLDCRTERMNNEIIGEQTCDLIWDRCHREIVKGETKHLIVLLGTPIAYPRVAMLKNFLNSRKSLGKAGVFGGLINKQGANVEIYDDHWTAKHHKSERTFLIEDLQDLAAEKSVRVTILSGDVHLAAIGQFFSNPKLDLPKDRDYRYMPNIISSAIADAPETEMVSDMLNKRNHVHHMDSNTDEDVIPIFTEDVDNKPRNNKRLLPRRNWCSIREYRPGTTPPATPDTEPEEPEPTEPRPGMLKRTLSLTRGDKPPGSGGLLRRLSGRGPPPTRRGLGRNDRTMSMDGPFPPPETGNSYFPSQPEPQPGQFHRRPTNLSLKAAKKAAKKGDDGVGGYVNLEGGLAVTLNLEVNPKDPSGITSPYKLLVPMLRFEGNEFDPPATQITKGWKKWLGVRRNKSPNYEEEEASEEEDDNDERVDYEQEDSPSESIVPVKQQEEEDGGRGLRSKLKFLGRLG